VRARTVVKVVPDLPLTTADFLPEVEGRVGLRCLDGAMNHIGETTWVHQ